MIHNVTMSKCFCQKDATLLFLLTVYFINRALSISRPESYVFLLLRYTYVCINAWLAFQTDMDWILLLIAVICCYLLLTLVVCCIFVLLAKIYKRIFRGSRPYIATVRVLNKVTQMNEVLYEYYPYRINF